MLPLLTSKWLLIVLVMHCHLESFINQRFNLAPNHQYSAKNNIHLFYAPRKTGH